jgi:putative cell wall-binding protein
MPARVITALVLLVVVAAGPPGVSAQEDPVFPGDTVAVGLGESSTPNVAVAVELSQATFAADGADVVLIGRDDLFADSLASGVAQDQGPLLLVPTAGPVPPVVLDEIERVGASRAVIFGGQNAVSDDVAQELAGAGLSVERREGASRIETAVAVARAEAPGASTALLARAGGVEGNPTSGFADALAAGGWSAATGWPVLLTQTEVLTGSTRDYLVEAGISEVKVMGGTAAISEAVVAELQSMGIAVERVAGPDRAATAVEVAKDRGAETAADVAHVIVTDGFSEDAWAAGFGAAARSAALDAPIVLGNVDSLPPATVEWLVPGPASITCALVAAVCEQARVELGFPAVLQVAVPSGAVTFTVTDGSSSAVNAALPDGTPVGLAFTCETAGCSELDWTTDGAFMAVLELGVDLLPLSGDVLEPRSPFGGATANSFDASAGLNRHLAVVTIPGGFGLREFGRSTGAGGQGPGEYGTLTTFQSFASHPLADDNFGAWLVQVSGELVVRSIEAVGDGSNVEVPAHVQRRPGAQLLGAAWPQTGGGDIAITDDIGGIGALRIAPYDGGPGVEGDGVDAASPPYWMPDGETVVVLADTSDGVSLVAVDATSGASEVLVQDAGDAAGGRIDADPSGTFVAWAAGTEIRVLDTRDGTVAVIAMPDGSDLAGGPAFRP